MKITHRSFIGSACLLVLCSLPGCQMASSGRSQRFVRAFVPPAPRPAPAADTEMPEPPKVESGFYLRDSPALLTTAAMTPENRFEAQHRLAKSDEHMRRGAELLGKAKTAEARLQFDAAVDWLVSAPMALDGRDRLVARHKEIVEEIYRLEVESAQAAGQEQEPVFDEAPFEDVADLTFPIDPRLKLKVREQVQASLSQLPLETSDPVLSFLNYFSTPKGKRVVMAGFKRSGRYAPMIRRILDEEGLPQELIHMAQAESGFLPRAVSRMRAAGMWQFVRDRGNEYGLKQTSATDDRLDPERATRAAARHLRDLYAQFGDWYLAIAAYNCGPGNVDRGIQRTGYADFWELYKRNVLPRETANYLPIILAMTIMAKNPADYGLDGIVPDEPVQYDTVTLDAPTHLALLADITEQPLLAIRELNPAVLKLVAPAKYAVRVPRGTAGAVVAALESVPETKRAHWRVHRVGSTETVAAIARQYRTTEKQIHLANGGALHVPEAGDLVVVPVSYPGAVSLKAAPVKKTVARRTSAARRTTASRKAGTAKRGTAAEAAASKSKTAAVSREEHGGPERGEEAHGEAARAAPRRPRARPSSNRRARRRQ
ncbi:MAG: transglycosylase SLT domain-containing protein [Bryobacterales bacterium]|nr:transglycosylase SLT domain-containing protein [Bryobacterales bacterium]